MGPQSCKSPKFGNFGTTILESWDKMSFGYGPHGEVWAMDYSSIISEALVP
jgi:hypothetical protein